MTEKDIYDKRKFYKTKLEPLIHELKLQCNMEHMPMFVTVAVKNDKAGTESKISGLYRKGYPGDFSVSGTA